MNARTREFIPVPEKPTVEECKRLVTVDRILIGVSSAVIREADPERGIKSTIEVKTVAVKNESEMKPELVMHGPTRRGEVNSYLGIDGRRHYFSAKTGEAIGSEMRPIKSRKAVDALPALPAR
jgi:hypothetical protein